MHEGAGSFHVKAGFLRVEGKAYFAAKLNANFPANPGRGLPTIQGAVLLSDAEDGAPLAIMDSTSITALRTAAASAVAARHLARRQCDTVLICGCGGQARAQLEALLCVREPRRVLVYDADVERAARFARAFGERAVVALDLAAAARASDIVITCTTASKYFLTRDMIRPGTFVAAVGADNENKQEIEPRLMAQSKVVTDLTEQARKIGDLHHAIDQGAMAVEAVHAQLGEVVAGRKPARQRDEEIIIFDSTGTGLQDVAAAIAAYHGATRQHVGTSWSLI
jgi:ornithine cyclodeaminase/alanine dehydrogenase-like protein (mu-crystallin family)